MNNDETSFPWTQIYEWDKIADKICNLKQINIVQIQHIGNIDYLETMSFPSQSDKNESL